jgi:hypothetical protein
MANLLAGKAKKLTQRVVARFSSLVIVKAPDVMSGD